MKLTLLACLLAGLSVCWGQTFAESIAVPTAISVRDTIRVRQLNPAKVQRLMQSAAVLREQHAAYTAQKTQAKPKHTGPSRWAKIGHALAVAGEVAGAVTIQVSIQVACTDVYNKPAWTMTAGDWQLLRSCAANGYWVYGRYVYVGQTNGQ